MIKLVKMKKDKIIIEIGVFDHVLLQNAANIVGMVKKQTGSDEIANMYLSLSKQLLDIVGIDEDEKGDY